MKRYHAHYRRLSVIISMAALVWTVGCEGGDKSTPTVNKPAEQATPAATVVENTVTTTSVRTAKVTPVAITDKALSAKELLDNFNYATIDWPGKPSTWKYIGVQDAKLTMLPHDLGTKEVTEFRVPLAADRYKIKGRVELDKASNPPVSFVIAIRQADSSETLVANIKLVAGESKEFDQSFTAGANSELTIKALLGEGAKNNWGAKLVVEGLELSKAVQEQATGTQEQPQAAQEQPKAAQEQSTGTQEQPQAAQSQSTGTQEQPQAQEPAKAVQEQPKAVQEPAKAVQEQPKEAKKQPKAKKQAKATKKQAKAAQE